MDLEHGSSGDDGSGNAVVGAPVAVRGKTSSLVQVGALVKKNMRIHMRTNACPCCPCLTFQGMAICNGCLLHVFCPIFFVFIVTVIPFVIIKVTSSQQDGDTFLNVQVVKGNVFKQWPIWQAGEFNVDDAACSLYGNPSGSPCMDINAAGVRPLMNTLFKPLAATEFDYGEQVCVAFPISCHCATLALVGPDEAVSKFQAFLENHYTTWVNTSNESTAASTAAVTAFNTEVLQRLGKRVAAPEGGKGPPIARRLTERRDVNRFGPRHISSEDVRQFMDDTVKDVQRLMDGTVEAVHRRLVGEEEGPRRLQSRRDNAMKCLASTPDVSNWCSVDAGRDRPYFRRFRNNDEVDKWIDDTAYGRFTSDRSPDSGMDRLCGAVIFENDVLAESKPKITLRLNVTHPKNDVSASLTKVQVSAGESFDVSYLEWYFESGFLALQHLTNAFLAQERAPIAGGARDLVGADPAFVPAPTSETRTWAFGDVVNIVLGNPFILSMMFGPIVATISFYISRERATRQRELMRMMGLADTALLWAWILMFCALNLFISFVMTIMFVALFFKKCQFIICWMVIWWFTNAVTTFGMAVAAFISSDRLAAMTAFGLFFSSSFLWVTVSEYDGKAKRALLALIPPDGLLAAFTSIWVWETQGIGVTGANAGTDTYHYNVNLGVMMLFLDFWLYLIIYYYVDNIAFWHGVGVARKLWFPFQPSFWREVFDRPPLLDQDSGGGSSKVADEPDGGPPPEFVEAEDEVHLKQLIQSNRCVLVRNLRKSFKNASGREIVAVNNLSLTMYQDECFCLLGHNGAGKTTTMMMLTGCMPQSRGTIKVKGCDIPHQVREIRSSMGFCPQHNVLIDELTVFEHLDLFGTIGGMTKKALTERGKQLLAAVALLDKLEARSSSLSGGMKRKLCCALAFLAEPFLVILDEPSSGMDPFARRGMWDTLKRWRTGHILCLTTHYMDEADALGDRIAIMSHGQLACSGTSTFLKKTFGLGYVIAFAKVTEHSPDEAILAVVRKVAGPEASIMSAVGKELLIQVPFTAAATFPELFPQIDAQQAHLGIESYGTSITNLEEVFLKVAKLHKPGSSALGGSQADEGPPPTPSITSGYKHFLLQLYALLIRRLKFGYRNPLNCCCQIGLPVLCVFIFCMILAVTTVNALPSLVLDTSQWNEDVKGTRAPITVGVINGSASFEAQIRDMWGSPPGVDKVTFQVLAPVEYPDKKSFPQPPVGVVLGLAEEAAFAKAMYDGKDQVMASQYGSVFYPQTSSWCPANFSSICDDMPGPTIFTNQSAPHSAAVMYGIHASLALNKRTGGGISGVEVSNHPFQKTATQRANAVTITGIFASIIVMASYGFVPAGATSYVVMEKEKDVKNQLIISGCSISAYWISNYIFDVVWGIIPCVGAWVTFAIWGIKAYTEAPGSQASVALFLLFLPAMAGFAYLMSFLFNRSGISLFTTWIFNLVFGILGTIVIIILTIVPNVDSWRITLRWIFRFVPIFSLGYGHLQVSLRASQAKELGVGPLAGIGVGGMSCPDKSTYPGTYVADSACTYLAGDEFLILCIGAVIFLGFTILWDVANNTPALKQLIGSPPPPIQGSTNGLEDEMVLAEKSRVEGVDRSAQFVYVRNIHKVYRGGMHAVRGISFAAAEGQVFGLLGVNGAGKTTTFKMLCGQVEPTAGEVCVQGFDMTKHADQARRLIGYCPQFDALLDTLTTEEHLHLYGRIKGLYGQDLAKAVRAQIADLDLDSYVQSRAGQLSGGNKRKLSVAMATIGEPPMVFLDEPSAGMDPVARRGMWSVIQNIADKRKKSVVILTTHSMEEAEALCSRIAIQVDGQFRCLGTAQQIKTRYGHGLELNVRLATPTPHELLECEQKLGHAGETLTQAVAKDKVIAAYGQTTFQELSSRPGSPFGRGAGITIPIAVVAEWTLLVVRTGALEAFLSEHLGPEAPGQAVAMPLEKSQNVVRYQIMPAVLTGKYRSLGALFNLFQTNKAALLLEDFQVCQPSLEQIFNKFATTQASQAAMRDAPAAGGEPPATTIGAATASGPAAVGASYSDEEKPPTPTIVKASSNPSASPVGKATE